VVFRGAEGIVAIVSIFRNGSSSSERIVVVRGIPAFLESFSLLKWRFLLKEALDIPSNRTVLLPQLEGEKVTRIFSKGSKEGMMATIFF